LEQQVIKSFLVLTPIHLFATKLVMLNLKLILKFFLIFIFPFKINAAIRSIPSKTLSASPEESPAVSDMLHGRIKIKEDNNLFFSPFDISGTLKIANSKDEISETLKRLSTNDEIYGIGEIDTTQNSVVFSTIERISLRRLLGIWWSDTGIINFESFTRVVLYPDKDEEIPTIECPDIQREKIVFQYSLVPGSNNSEWVMFLSNCSRTYYTTIELNGNFGIVKIYGSSTGKVLRVVYLQRNLPQSKF